MDEQEEERKAEDRYVGSHPSSQPLRTPTNLPLSDLERAADPALARVGSQGVP